MIFLTLLYLCIFSGPWNTLALPTGSRPPEILPKNHWQSIFIREDRFDTRSIYNILWSCLSTIFACTWITIHPNIPAPGDSDWAVPRRRVAIMVFFLLAPEFIIIWAARQYFGAHYLTKKYEKHHTDWTQAHSFFLIMGGFVLHEGGKPVRVLVAEDLEELSKAERIEWPTITKKEIADRSKGDYLSKTIVLFQATWFIGQCLARWRYRLTVTELEVVTVAFASLTGVIYCLWWDKPLDVRCSIPVDLLPNRLGKINGDPEKEETGPQIIPFPKICAQRIPEKDEKVVDNLTPLLTTSMQVDISSPDPAPTRMQQFQAFRRDACDEHGTLFGLGYVFILFPLFRFSNALGAMSTGKTLEDKSLRVPTFYSPYSPYCNNYGDVLPSYSAMGGICVAIAFGAIHCTAWSFHFATFQERWLWRISAVLVSGLPISFIPWRFLYLKFHRKPEENKPTWMLLCKYFLVLYFFVMWSLYIFARIVLLILPFVALRALPPGAYVQINWVGFLPHI